MESKLDHDISFKKYSGINNIEEYYQTINQIGSGSFGIVYKAKCLQDGSLWAIKRTERVKTTYSQWEVHLLSIIKHKNIVFVKELIETDKYSFMIMEYCVGGSVKEQFDKVGKFNELEIKHVMIQFAEAIHYLHNRNIAHRDLKMENLLLQIIIINTDDVTYTDNRFSNYLIKLIDFGLSIKLKTNEEMMFEYCGTPLYMSPEIIRGTSYSKQCDVWSMGIVMLILMLGKLPFNNIETLQEDILNFDMTNNNLLCELTQFSQLSIEALRALLHRDPSYRCSASEFLNYTWISGMNHKESTNVLQLMKEMANLRNNNNKSNNKSTINNVLENNGQSIIVSCYSSTLSIPVQSNSLTNKCSNNSIIKYIDKTKKPR